MGLPQRVAPAPTEDHIQSRLARTGFAAVPHAVTADRQLSDEGFRLLVALESWAWNKSTCHPCNRDIAFRAGWFTKSGQPSISKVKRVLRELEGLNGGRAYIRRVVISGHGQIDRQAIELLRPMGEAAPKGDETPGSKMDYPGSKMAHKEEALKTSTTNVLLHLESDSHPHESSSKRPLIEPAVSSEAPTSRDGNEQLSDPRRDEVNQIIDSLPGVPKGPTRNRMTLRFARLCVQLVDDRKRNIPCHRLFARFVAEECLSPQVIRFCLDTLEKHKALKEVKCPRRYYTKMVLKRLSNSALDEAAALLQLDPAKFKRDYCATPNKPAVSDEPEPF